MAGRTDKRGEPWRREAPLSFPVLLLCRWQGTALVRLQYSSSPSLRLSFALSACHLVLMCSFCVTQIVGPRLPMDPLSEALFTETSDGLILCKLINLAEFDTIDSRSGRPHEHQHVDEHPSFMSINQHDSRLAR